MSTLYQDANWSLKDLNVHIEKLKEQVTKSKTSALSKDRLGYYINALVEKSRSGHSVSITDLWGLIIESFLSGQENKTKLSDQQRAIRRGQNPFPIYASLNVRSNLSARDFGEWFECTPYEAGLPKYGAYIPIQHFGSKFFMGYLIKKCPEMRISFLEGQWGSAFAANLEEILREMIGTSNMWMQNLQNAIKITDNPQTRKNQPPTRTIIPSGLLDTMVLKKTADFCKEHDIPFPKIDVADILENSLQECYVFMDENNPRVPIVVHFPLTNATFKDYVSPGVPRTSEEDKVNHSFVLEAENSPYSTLNFTYTPDDFDKLIDLNCYNVMNSKDIILMILSKALAKRRGAT
ncbi:hypothetical protein chiPu_0014289 [Chiloscyllium punctatum]|uniref:PLA2c domain-containing protein n=1 Tax=Chiloscyllium punctatum TaxID=137246 RepID=A0A401SZJ0_CHIPU|nr:hypothetical protein [Chiloscyllium punctatum]